MRSGVFTLVFLLACGGSSNPHMGGDGSNGGGDGSQMTNDGHNPDTPAGGFTRSVFVILMENESAAAIYGNTAEAPYINSLVPTAAKATMFQDELPADPSEPHYVYMEGGTATFSDVTFTNDNDPSSGNSTASTAHLVNTLEAAGVTWMTYQEDMTANTCPINSSGFYAAKHDPFIFYKDVAGNPPSTSTARCKAHHKPYTSFATDLNAGNMANYVFITPNLCNDMHGAGGCGGTSDINNGDKWLQAEMPRIITYAQAHDGIVFLSWDEGDSTNLIPFLAIGPRIQTGSVATVYNHGSMIKTIQETFGVTPLAKVNADNDFTAMYKSGMFP